jgi:ribonuclease Z
VLHKAGLSKIIAVEVDHCPFSYGCLLITDKNEKVIYSGDTLPCRNFANYAEDCKVMIHEATFEDSLAQDAYQKKHTCTGDAIELA